MQFFYFYRSYSQNGIAGFRSGIVSVSRNVQSERKAVAYVLLLQAVGDFEALQINQSQTLIEVQSLI